MSWRLAVAEQAWSRTAWVLAGELCGIVTIDGAVAAFGGGCAEGEGQAEIKSKSEAGVFESGWFCSVGVFCGRGWFKRAWLRQSNRGGA